MPTRGQNGAGVQRINVLQVIGNALFGGMERYVLDLVCHLPDDQFRVTCVCPFESAFTAELEAYFRREVRVPDLSTHHD